MREWPAIRVGSVAAVGALTASLACAARVQPIDATTVPAPDVRLPLQEGSARFAVIGDAGTGGSAQYRVAAQLIAAHTVFPFEFVLMTGDNLYGSEDRSDYQEKFAIPYGPLLDAGVEFYASLGNHDDDGQVFYEPFNMGGERFYSFTPKRGVRIFALDSTYMSPEQLAWLEGELSASRSRWKVAFFHHPLYSAGRHGSDVKLRQELEPLFVEHAVSVVFVGHEHFYERLKPQKGVHYFTTGAAAKLRRGDIDRSTHFHAAGYDQGYHFMLVEVVDDTLHFQAISDTGRTVDAGTIRRASTPRSVARTE